MADSTFYSTAAQVIPTLLVVVAIEDRLRPHERTPLLVRVYLALFTAVAVAGEFAALRALMVGDSPGRAILTFAGLTTGACLTLQTLPMYLMTHEVGDERTHNRYLVVGSAIGLVALLASILV